MKNANIVLCVVVVIHFCVMGGILLSAPSLGQQSFLRETEQAKLINEKLNGTLEAKTPDGSRVDILTDEYAYEVDWAYKWPQAIGQSLYYAAATNRKPGIILLFKNRTEERRYYLRCLVVCNRYNIRLITKDAVR